jgi:hypothetical protein
MGWHHLELYTLAYEGRMVQPAKDSQENNLDSLIRELFEMARTMNLQPPQQRPSKRQIEQALLELGFTPKPQAEPKVRTLHSR